jgi:hypothetical protein
MMQLSPTLNLLASLRKTRSELTDELPIAHVEPVDLAVVHGPASSGVMALRVRAVRGVCASDVHLSLPLFARPGKTAELVVKLSPTFPASEADEIAVAVRLVAAHIHACASIVRVHGTPPLHLAVRVAAIGTIPAAVSVLVDIPATAVSGDILVLSSIRIGGAPVALPASGRPDGSVGCQIPINRGMVSPKKLAAPPDVPRLDFNYSTPVISDDGKLYIPRWNTPRNIAVFEADGSYCPAVTVADMTTEALAYDEGSGMLFAGGDSSDAGSLAAVDVRTGPVPSIRWSRSFDSSRVFGATVLPALVPQALASYLSDSAPIAASASVLVTASRSMPGKGCLRVHGVSDGVELATVSVDGEPVFLAADPLRSTVYASIGNAVRAVDWNGSDLRVRTTPVLAAGHHCRPLAFVPPAPGKSASYLIVGGATEPDIVVLALPSHDLVHTHSFPGMQIRGLAADPSGTAIAVCNDADSVVEIIPWPLPGMALA